MKSLRLMVWLAHVCDRRFSRLIPTFACMSMKNNVIIDEFVYSSRNFLETYDHSKAQSTFLG